MPIGNKFLIAMLLTNKKQNFNMNLKILLKLKRN